MTKHNITCILCPLSCSLQVTKTDGQITEVSGYGCKLGREYAPQELLNPARVVTSTVKLTAGPIARLPVKTAQPIPKDKIFACMQEIKQIVVNSPVRCGQVIKEKIIGSEIDLIATRSLPDR